MTIIRFATALSISVAAALAQDPTQFGLRWDNKDGDNIDVWDDNDNRRNNDFDNQVRLEFDLDVNDAMDRKDVTMSRAVSDWTLQRLDMAGWFLKPQTPLDGCYLKEALVPEEEKERTWWEIQAEKEQTEEDIRFRMNQSFVYKDCRAAIEKSFDVEKQRVEDELATLDNKLLTQYEYENPIQASSELDPEAIDLYQQATDLQVELDRINAEYGRLVAEVEAAKRDKRVLKGTWQTYLFSKRTYDFGSPEVQCNV